MTYAKFIAAYRAYAVAHYAWTADTAKLEEFMAAVTETLAAGKCTWAWDGPGTKEVWKAIGCKGRPTLKGLRALPE